MDKKYSWFLVFLFTLITTTSCRNSSSGSSEVNNSKIGYVAERKIDVLSDYTPYVNFETSNEYKGIYTRDNSYFLVTKKGALVPTQKWDYESDGNKACFITFIGGGYRVISQKGVPMINKTFDEYELYPYGTYFFGKTTDGWNAYNLSENDPESMFTIDFEDCRVTSDGMLLLANGDVFLSRTDEGELLVFNISEEERKQERLEQEEAERLRLMALIFMNMNAASASQIQQMNNIYSNTYEVYSRPRSQIEADIAKYEREKSFCESHMNDGIAEGMGYSNIISNYNSMIQEREQELRYAR